MSILLHNESLFSAAVLCRAVALSSGGRGGLQMKYIVVNVLMCCA